MSGNPGAGVLIIGTLTFREPERLPLETQIRLRELAIRVQDGRPLTRGERLYVAYAAYRYLEYVNQ